MLLSTTNGTNTLAIKCLNQLQQIPFQALKIFLCMQISLRVAYIVIRFHKMSHDVYSSHELVLRLRLHKFFHIIVHENNLQLVSWISRVCNLFLAL